MSESYTTKNPRCTKKDRRNNLGDCGSYCRIYPDADGQKAPFPPEMKEFTQSKPPSHLLG
jgi:hypothetical protein